MQECRNQHPEGAGKGAEGAQEARDRALFDAIAADYCRKDVVASSRIARRDMLLRAVAPNLKQHGNMGRLLELGCGIAAPALYLQGSYREYIGVDHSSEMIEIARRFTADVPGVTLMTGSAKATGLKDASMDTILLSGVLHHVDDLDAVMREIRRVARPGARLICIEPHRGNPVFQAMRWLRTRIDAHYSAEQHFFSRHELADLFQRHDICDPSLRYFTIFSQPFAQVILPPQLLLAPLSRAACVLDMLLERLLLGGLGRLTWQIVASGTIPSRSLTEKAGC